MRVTTTGVPTRARADIVLPNPRRSTPPRKPPAPRTIIRTRRNRPSSRAEATGSFQIQPRVGHDEFPSLARLYHRHPLTTLCARLLLCYFCFPPLLCICSLFFTLLLLCALFLSLCLTSVFSFYLSGHLCPPVSPSATFFFRPAPSSARSCSPIIASASCFLLSHGLFSWLP